MPSPLSAPRGRRSALRRIADGNVAAVSPRPTRSHAHRCSRLTRQHGGEQSGLVTLTFKVVSESRVTWATFVQIVVFLGLSVLDLVPMYGGRREAGHCGGRPSTACFTQRHKHEAYNTKPQYRPICTRQ